MPDLRDHAAILVELYDLRNPPTPEEAGVIAAQIERLAAMMRTPFAPSGALFDAEPSDFRSTLDRLAENRP